MMASLNQIKKELVNLLRNNDIISTGNRGVTTVVESNSVSGLTYTPQSNPTQLKNIRYLQVEAINYYYGKDYTFNFETGVITFTSSQNGTINLSYDYGTTDRIFPDYPQANLKLNQFPRIAVDIISNSTTEFEIGASSNQSTYTVSIISYNKSQEEIEEMNSNVKDLISNYKKELYYSAFITPTDTGPILISDFGDNKVFQRNQDCQVRFNVDSRTPGDPFPIPPSTLLTDIIAYYKMDENAGDMLDSVGSNDGVTTGVTYAVTGIVNTGYDMFTGDKVVITNNLSGKSNVSCNVWGKLAGVGNDKGIVNGDSMIQFPTTALGNFEMVLDINNIRYKPASTLALDTNWHMFTFSYNGAEIKFYIDGLLKDTVPATGNIDNTGGLDFGLGAVWIPWNGTADELTMWDKTLSQSEITELYGGGLGNQYPFT